jgi:molybdate transport system regulatory protein
MTRENMARGAMAPRLTIRLDFSAGRRLGVGKVALLESIEKTGSISAAGRAHKMSYRRAWLLVDELNQIFDKPVVSAHPGGSKGGGASLTDQGRRVVALFRDAEAKTRASAQDEIDELERSLCVDHAKREFEYAKAEPETANTEPQEEARK